MSLELNQAYQNILLKLYSQNHLKHLSYASVTFATVVVRFSCLRFSLRFFRHRRRQHATTFAFTLLTITLRFLSATARTKPNIDLADIVRQPQGHRTVIELSLRQPHINHTMVSVRWQTSWQARPTVLVI